ncbi:MAG: class I SAM-dependent methyltransferase [Acidimicrobiales bacterium]
MLARPRWFSDDDPGRSRWYVERFRRLAAEGADLDGEARLADAIFPPGSYLLDAGCGTGRLGAALAARGHRVVGVDVDPVLIEAAAADHPGPSWLVGDLAELDLGSTGCPTPFDGAVLAGNVMTFVAPGTEQAVLEHVGSHVHRDGAILVGFGTDRGYPLDRFDADLAAAGLHLDLRFATWDLRPFGHGADFAVSLLRRP